MRGVQAPELPQQEEPAEHPGSYPVDEVLSLGQAAHAAPGDQVGRGQ